MVSEREDLSAEQGEEEAVAAANPATERVRMNFWIRRDIYAAMITECEKQDVTATHFMKLALQHYLKTLNGA